MRSCRGAKFAEYLSTYAILNGIGVHDSVVIEKRDSSTGFGVFVRDACDRGTSLMVVPSRRCCATSVLQAVGTPVSLALTDGVLEPLNGGLMTYLTGSHAAVEWVEWCWRLSLERHRSCSPLWGWLEALPPLPEFEELVGRAEKDCRVLYTPLLPHYRMAQQRMREEMAMAYTLLKPRVLTSPAASFYWACWVLLSRGLTVPRCWGRDASPGAEIGVVPYLDLVNGGDDAGRQPNAVVEVAATAKELPDWYRTWLAAECSRQGKSLTSYLTHLLETHYCVCLTLEQPVMPADEVLLDYSPPPITTKVLSERDDQRLSRLVKYFY